LPTAAPGSTGSVPGVIQIGIAPETRTGRPAESVRIVCAVERYAPHVDGSTVYATGLCEALARRGHQVCSVATDRVAGRSPYRPLEELRNGVRVLRVASKGPRARWTRRVRHRWRSRAHADPFGLVRPIAMCLADRIQAERPELVVAVAASTGAVVAAAQVARRLSLPAVGVPFYHVDHPGFVRSTERWMEVLRSFRRLLVCTEAEARYLADRGIDPTRIARPGMFVRPPVAIEPADVSRWRAERGIGDAFVVATAATAFVEPKGIFDLARAARVLPHVRFVFLGGEAPSRAALSAAVPLGRNVELAGFVEEREKARVLHAADLFALPSQADSFGIAYIEAHACGTPALAADLPAMREVLGPLGDFVPFGDVPALIRAIEVQRLRRTRRAGLAPMLRRHAERFAEGPALERIVAAIEGV